MTEIITGVKNYIIECRKKNIPDSKIIETLKNSKWPDDIIESAIKEANLIISSVKESPSQTIEVVQKNKEQQTINQSIQTHTTLIQANTLTNTTQDTITQTSQAVQTKISDDLFTKPPILQDQKPNILEEKPKKVFTPWVIIALILSPIPLIGLGVSMSVLDYVNKNNYSGKIIAYLSLVISLFVLFYILYLIYQIFTLPPDQLTGFAKSIVEKFNLLGY
ncbi:MAG: hypothetical protein QXE31_01830 [Candidatus Woesearchaeota archaeon]